MKKLFFATVLAMVIASSLFISCDNQPKTDCCNDSTATTVVDSIIVDSTNVDTTLVQ